MDEAVERNRQVNITVIGHVHVEPVEEEDAPVMIHVEEAQLLPLLSNDDEERVEEVQDLAQVEDPEELSQRRRRQIDWLARYERVVIPARYHHGIHRHVRAEHD